ncbi:NAD-dependent epimerase/dehydratase [Sphaerulina musiva SO2202]|uniref:NAD-dependent epimerase/dehydratase n=1 Tax=Sphaerulina musiva (strain SO2202) TaxID=692275 RepID=M3DET1_SPHMS|nr:NAD-dependent epimerase/dehydratase [Sphaerulina musiva SO2202]EMF16024.1 NAD-dependent epimerase/dehydratase [Sphaerulina musiva SO2202]
MPSTLILGGSGKVARHITRILSTEENHTVHSLIRSESQIPSIRSLGGHPIVQSLETASVPDLIQTIHNTQPSTIIFAAGAGAGSPASRTSAVDFGSAVKAAEATAQSGVTKRYIIISALDVRDRENCRVPDWYDEKDRVMSERVWGAIGHYMQAKFEADRDLVRENGRRGLEYTIVRPGGLRDEEGTGRIEAGKVHFGERMIAREDVARAVVEIMKNDGTKGLAIDMVGGDTLTVKEAIAKVADERINTFEGMY